MCPPPNCQSCLADLSPSAFCFPHLTSSACVGADDLVPKGVHENRAKGVENKVEETLKLVVFLECAQC